MTRQRMYLDMSCVDAARARVRHVIETFDHSAVMFSGGKDSTAVLHLVHEVHEELGLGPVKVIFRDEEMVSPSVVRFIEEVRDYPWTDFHWVCLPQGQEIWVLGRREHVLLWSGKRSSEGRLVRPIPDGALTAEHWGLDPNKPIPESIDYYTMSLFPPGSVAYFTGVRANESMIRYRSCVQKLHENYINIPYRMKKSIPLRFAKVIYDWETNDVFKYVVERGGTFCDFYDLAALTRSNTRVGIPLHSVAIRRIGDVVATEPEFYDQLVRCFPQIDAQRRYWPEFDIEGLIEGYSVSGWDGVRACIEDNMLTPGLKRRAMAYAAEFRKKHGNHPSAYPIHWLIRNLLMHEFHGTSVNPIGPGTKAHAIQQAAEMAELDSLDLIDDLR